MATTFKRICIKSEKFTDGDKVQELKRGSEYITSREKDDGTVIVITAPYWIYGVPANLFAGEVRFT